jgi:hypothetical protein
MVKANILIGMFLSVLLIFFSGCINSNDYPIQYSQGNETFKTMDQTHFVKTEMNLDYQDPANMSLVSRDVQFFRKGQTISMNFQIGSGYAPAVLEIGDLKLKVAEYGNYTVLVPGHLDANQGETVWIRDSNCTLLDYHYVVVHDYDYEQDCKRSGKEVTTIEYSPAAFAPFRETLATKTNYTGNVSNITNLVRSNCDLELSFNIAAKDTPAYIFINENYSLYIKDAGSYEQVHVPWYDKNTTLYQTEIIKEDATHKEVFAKDFIVTVNVMQ